MIPINTTTVSVLRATQSTDDEEPYSGAPESARTAVAKGIRAVISSPTGSEIVRGGEETVILYQFFSDPVEIKRDDWVKDESNGETYKVVWSQLLIAFGLDHVVGQLRIVEGAV